MVGPSNSDFRPLQAIPQRLQYAIMTSEDGAFFYHRGFLPDAIRESLIKNIKERRFARGGSTISMQLVKNLFLTRNKNITRKVEEMLITWLIESERLVSKERMMEVYLNVIETGPMVYGVNEAAHFYFAKDVSKLTLAESFFIASIVPKPKWFKYSFDSNGQLREHMKAYYELVSGKMLGKGWFTEQEHQALLPVVDLKGPARNLVILSDSIPADFEEDME
jgi:membrane peptidoglycan carboxypeptidase